MLPNDRYARLASDWWLHVNVDVFGAALRRPPAIRIVESATFLGRWMPDLRVIELSELLVHNHDWLEVVEVLKHEMAHQYVSDVLGVEDESAHGPAFQMVCRRFAICHRAAGLSPKAAAKRKKIEALLALGESSNTHEAENALRKARQLMQEVGLGDAIESTEDDAISARPVGAVNKKVEPHHYSTAGLLGEFFNVRCIWIETLNSRGHMGTQLEIIGTNSDLEIAEYVHDFVIAEAHRFWGKEGASGIRKERDFKEGFVVGLRQALKQERSQTAHEPGLVRMATELDQFFKRRHPRVRSSAGSQRQRGEMFGQGIGKGKSAKIRKGVQEAASPKLLGPHGQ